MTDYLQLNADPVELADPGLLRATGYGHFTSMQVRSGFAAGDRIVWPATAALPGIAMLSLQAGLDAITVARETVPIPLSVLDTFDAAYLTNSIDPALPVSSIATPTGTTQYEPHPASAALIAKAYEAIPLQQI